MSDHAGFQAERRLSSDEDSRGGIDSPEASSGCLDSSCDWSIDRDSLRIFLLGRDGRKPLFHRAAWKTDNGSYAAQRKFLQLWAKGQRPDRESDLGDSGCADGGVHESGPTTAGRPHGGINGEDAFGDDTCQLQRLSGDARTCSIDQNATAMALQDMEVAVEESEMPISVIKFATASSSLLAAGDEAGQVRIIQLGSEGSEVVQMLEHNAGVSDLDWSEANTSIVTCCEDGMVVLWGFAGDDGWECLRALEIVGSAICCRFHPENQNYVTVGSALGSVLAMNSSTGSTVSEYVLQTRAREGVFASALDCSKDFTFVGDSRGHLVVLESAVTESCTEPSLNMVFRSLPPTSERVPILSVQYLEADGGPIQEAEVLTYQADGCVCLWSLNLSEGRVLRVTRKLKAMIPAPSRYTNAVYCPPGTCSKGSRAVAVGCLHPGVTVYDTGNLNSQQTPAAVMQLQGPLSPVVALTWSCNMKVLAAGDIDGSVILWKAPV